MAKISSKNIDESAWHLRSMTGLGQANFADNGICLSVVMRAVNQRGLEVKVRAGNELQSLEQDIVAKVASKLARGRVDVTIEWDGFGLDSTALSFDAEKAGALVEHLFQFQKAHPLVDKNITLGQLLSCGHLLSTKKCGIDEQALKHPLFSCLDKALADLILLRTQEGSALSGALKKMLINCLDLIHNIEATVNTDVSKRFELLKMRTDELFEKYNLDQDRIYQECALLAERSDFKEEIDRLLSHIEHFNLICKNDAPKGRKLDFLCQEMLRESNTFLSKVFDHSAMIKAIDLKAEIERLREQVQNIE